ncbi:dipeptide epimerase [Bacillus carboniphilus]|uniref:Dipeptide epimerase n=1 Tax=Bacillus carboniphilus TaxID=86663 RepID=A0ABN0VUI1_9BACI
MKIVQIEATCISLPLNTDLNISGGKYNRADRVYVKITTDQGIYGWGEAAPIPQYAEETMESVKFIIDKYLAPLLIGQDPMNLAQIHEQMKVIKGNNFAKAAIDFACYDISGKALGVPVYTLLGGKYRDKVAIGQSIGIKSIDHAVEEAHKYAEEGFQSIKIKIGIDPDHDVKTVGAIRERLPDIPIRVDANQGYRLEQAIHALSRMEEYNLLLIEQPVPKWDLDGMAELCRLLRTPILADESLYTIHDAVQLIKHKAADIFNIKIMKPGGLYPSLKIAGMAEAAGIPLSIGSMIEAGVGTAAGAHFAAAVKYLEYPSDIKGPTLYSDDVLQEPVRIEKGFTYVPDGPGLGVEVDQEKINHYKVDL